MLAMLMIIRLQDLLDTCVRMAIHGFTMAAGSRRRGRGLRRGLAVAVLSGGASAQETDFEIALGTVPIRVSIQYSTAYDFWSLQFVLSVRMAATDSIWRVCSIDISGNLPLFTACHAVHRVCMRVTACDFGDLSRGSSSRFSSGCCSARRGNMVMIFFTRMRRFISTLFR